MADTELYMESRDHQMKVAVPTTCPYKLIDRFSCQSNCTEMTTPTLCCLWVLSVPQLFDLRVRGRGQLVDVFFMSFSATLQADQQQGSESNALVGWMDGWED